MRSCGRSHRPAAFWGARDARLVRAPASWPEEPLISLPAKNTGTCLRPYQHTVRGGATPPPAHRTPLPHSHPPLPSSVSCSRSGCAVPVPASTSLKETILYSRGETNGITGNFSEPVFAVLSLLQAGSGGAVRTPRGWGLSPVCAQCTVDFDTVALQLFLFIVLAPSKRPCGTRTSDHRDAAITQGLSCQCGLHVAGSASAQAWV